MKNLKRVLSLMMAVLLARTSRLLKEPKDDEALKSWLEQQLAAQAKDFSARQDAVAQQNYAAIRSVSETLQTAVQGMSTTLGQGQDSQQRILEQRLRSLEQANTQQMEQLRQAVLKEFPDADIRVAYIGPVIGAHTGPGMLALIYWGTNR